jgi:hypothetical protein
MNATDSAALHVLIVFDRQEAYRSALRTLAQLDVIAGGEGDIRLTAVPLAQLAEMASKSRPGAVADAADADLILLALSEPGAPLGEFCRLLLDAAPGRMSAERLLVVLPVGTASAVDCDATSWQSLELAARNAGVGFLAPAETAGDLPQPLSGRGEPGEARNLDTVAR